MSIARTVTVEDPSTENLEIRKGNDLDLVLTVKDTAGAAVNISGYAIRFTVYDIEAAANEFQLSNVPISAGTWATQVVSFTTGFAHSWVTGSVVTVADCGNASYNGTYTILTAPTTTSFTATKASDPGTFTTSGNCSSTEITMTTPASGVATVHLLTAVTNITAKNYLYDVFIKSSAGQWTVANGIFRIFRALTTA